MIVLFLELLLQKIILFVKLNRFLLLFGCAGPIYTFFGIREKHFMKTLFLFLFLHLLLLPKNLITLATSHLQLLTLHYLPVLLILFGQNARKDIFFDIELVGIG